MAAKDSENGVNKGFEMRQQIKRTKWESFQNTLYDPSTKEILGRTGNNWGKLLIFYSLFYLVLAALFAICMQGLLATLDDKEPTWQLDRSLIGTNPGLGFRPISERTEEGSLITYDKRNYTSGQKWVNLTEKFLEPYKKGQVGGNFDQCTFDQPPGAGKVCAVNLTGFGNCQLGNSYGYNSSSPCVFLKLNKIFGWEPVVYTEPATGMKEELVDVIKVKTGNEKKQIWVSCEGESPFDKEHNISFKYYPTRGFPFFYFPYKNGQNYLSPLVAVEVQNVPANILVSIECRAWAKNIIYRGGDLQREGSVHFEILMRDGETNIKSSLENETTSTIAPNVKNSNTL